MRVIVTRPAPQAGKWVKALRDAGHDALALPLIDIGPPADAKPVLQAWLRAQHMNALMFVSANAVQHFFALRPKDVAIEPCFSDVRFWATGPGTRAALLSAGVAPLQIDAPQAQAGQFDSEALWQVCHGQVAPGGHFLIVRGTSQGAEEADPDKGLGRNWLAERIVEAGAAVDFVVAYERRTPVWGANTLALSQVVAADGSVWLFSSSEAITNLRALVPGLSWASARALTTHPRIAQAARDIGFGAVYESRPGLPEIIASIESLA